MGWSRFIPAGAFVILVVFLGIGLTRDPSLIPTEMINRDMPAFELTELYDADAPVTDADLFGEPALVNVFGSWCVACLQEHPTLMQLNQDDTVRIVGVNWRDEREDAINWLQRHGDPYDTIIFDGESDLAIASAGYPDLNPQDLVAPLDADGDGIPNEWEERHGLSTSAASNSTEPRLMPLKIAPSLSPQARPSAMPASAALMAFCTPGSDSSDRRWFSSNCVSGVC